MPSRLRKGVLGFLVAMDERGFDVFASDDRTRVLVHGPTKDKLNKKLLAMCDRHKDRLMRTLRKKCQTNHD